MDGVERRSVQATIKRLHGSRLQDRKRFLSYAGAAFISLGGDERKEFLAVFALTRKGRMIIRSQST